MDTGDGCGGDRGRAGGLGVLLQHLGGSEDSAGDELAEGGCEGVVDGLGHELGVDF